MNNPSAGNEIFLLTLISFSFKAGLIKPTNSLMITGIPITIPTNAETYI